MIKTVSVCVCPGRYTSQWRSQQDAPPGSRWGPAVKNISVKSPAQQGSPPTCRRGGVHPTPQQRSAVWTIGGPLKDFVFGGRLADAEPRKGAAETERLWLRKPQQQQSCLERRSRVREESEKASQKSLLDTGTGLDSVSCSLASGWSKARAGNVRPVHPGNPSGPQGKAHREQSVGGTPHKVSPPPAASLSLAAVLQELQDELRLVLSPPAERCALRAETLDSGGMAVTSSRAPQAEKDRRTAGAPGRRATEYHLGLLKAKLAKYRAQLLEPSKSSGTKGEGFDVMKSGDARVALIGFPSVGKSTFLSLMTSTASEAASYEFTTLTCIPGVIEYKGANIQLLDLPGIIEGAAQGKGRGRQVIAVARTADVVIMMLDATKGDVQRCLLEKELESVGIRLNMSKPNIYFKPKKGGGISYNSTVPLTQCSEKLVQLILHEYKIFNAEVLFREDCSPDEFIDVIVGNRVYMPCLYGTSTKYSPQRVGLTHIMEHEDVIQIVKK
ncbi:DRG2 protein, partial [Polypterus senegalus]